MPKKNIGGKWYGGSREALNQIAKDHAIDRLLNAKADAQSRTIHGAQFDYLGIDLESALGQVFTARVPDNSHIYQRVAEGQKRMPYAVTQAAGVNVTSDELIHQGYFHSVEVNGYKMDVMVGKPKGGKFWVATDLKSGMAVSALHPTRKGALDHMKERFAERPQVMTNLKDAHKAIDKAWGR